MLAACKLVLGTSHGRCTRIALSSINGFVRPDLLVGSKPFLNGVLFQLAIVPSVDGPVMGFGKYLSCESGIACTLSVSSKKSLKGVPD